MADYLDQAVKNRQAIADIKRKYLSGEISRDEAKQLAQPILDRINARAIQIAAKHGRNLSSCAM
jgi:hypothetical protein